MKDAVREWVDELWELADEIYAREFSSNSVYNKFHSKSWDDLCNRVICLGAKLKAHNKKMDLELLVNDEHYSYNSCIEDMIDDLLYIESLPDEE